MSNHPAPTHLNLTELAKQLGGHSIFSPSSSAMWFNCSGSLIAHLGYKDSAGIDAAEGTVAHSVGEQWLRTGVRPSHLIGTTQIVEEGDQTFEIEITEKMLDFVQQYVDWCAFLPGSHYVETRVYFSELTPLKNQSGTADHAACEYQILTITDLKYGQGNIVFAENNTQAILYAYGFFKEWDWLYDFRTIRIRIAQPRLNHFDEWIITREELLAWAARIKERAFMAWCADAPRTAGTKQCQWCRAKPDCAAHAVFLERMSEGVFDDLDAEVSFEEMQRLEDKLDKDEFSLSPLKIGSLTTAQKAKLLTYRKMIESWFTELYADLEFRCLAGEDVPGYKIVESRSERQFISEDKALEHLVLLGVPEEKLYTRKFVGIGKVEEELLAIKYKRKDIGDLLEPIVRKPPGKATMAPISDKRVALNVGSTFDDLDAEL